MHTKFLRRRSSPVIYRSCAATSIQSLEGRRLLSGSDLQFAGAIAVDPSAAHPGAQIHVNFLLKNAGEHEAAASSTRVQIVRGTTVILTANFDEGSLAAGASRQESDVITLPTPLESGTYTASVHLDQGHTALQGTNTANDEGHGTFTVAPAALPNLVPSEVAPASLSAHPGDALTLSWKISNSGAAAALATTTDIRLGSSETVAPSADATLLHKPTGEIAAGLSIHQDGSITIPAGTAPGRYFLWVVADAAVPPVLIETSTADNAAHSVAITITATELPKPNLTPSTVAAAASSAHAGDTVHVSWQLANSGAGAAAATTTDVRLGTSDAIPPGQASTLLSKPTEAFAPQTSRAQDATITIPAGTMPGTYFLWVIADAAVPPVLTETTTTDNAAHSHAIVITVAEVAGKPNLVPSGVQVSGTNVQAGSTINVSWTLANAGNAVAHPTTTTVRLGTSESAFPDTVLTAVQSPAIAANASITQSAMVTIPASTPPGRYFIWIGADVAGVLTQSSTTDDHAHSAGFSVTAINTVVPLHLAFASAISDTSAGKKINEFAVLVEDPDNNVVITSKLKITLAKASGPAEGKLLGTTAVKARNGRAVFSGVSIRTAGTYVLAATAEGDAPATSNPFAITPGEVTTASFTLPADGLAANPQTVTVSFFDRYGNAANPTSPVALALASKPKEAVLSGILSATPVAGTATFADLHFSLAGTYSLSALLGSHKYVSRKFALH